MKWAVWIIAILLLPGCGAVPQQPLTLPPPLEGEIVEQGHLCDPRALAQAISHKYPSIDPATASEQTNHLLYVFGCGPPAPAPPSFAAPFAADLRAQKEEIPLGRQGNTYSVPVRINDTITLPFVLDTGATDLVIPADVALTLIRAGALTSGDFLGKSRYSMANGSEQVSDRVMIRAVQVGDHIIRTVTAMVSPPAGDPLLGQSSVEIWCGDPRLQTACSRFITLRK